MDTAVDTGLVEFYFLFSIDMHAWVSLASSLCVAIFY